MSDPRYWVIAASKEHVQYGVSMGIAQANHGKAAPLKRMQVGDGILYYSPKVTFPGNEKLQAFTAIGQVKGDAVYQFDMGDGFVPFRRDISYFECHEVSILPLIPALSFIENKQGWGYIFRFGFFEIPKVDYDLISNQMLLEKDRDD